MICPQPPILIPTFAFPFLVFFFPERTLACFSTLQHRRKCTRHSFGDHNLDLHNAAYPTAFFSMHTTLLYDCNDTYLILAFFMHDAPYDTHIYRRSFVPAGPATSNYRHSFTFTGSNGFDTQLRHSFYEPCI